jgi:DNA-binding NtrC family response regulator
VILLTGYSEAITQASARKMGIRGFAYKPLVMQELAEIIRNVLDRP